MKTKNYFVLLMMLFVGGLTFSACNDDDDYVYIPTAYVNYVNAYAGVDRLDIVLDNNLVNNSFVPYGKYIPYGLGRTIPGTRKFRAIVTGTNDVLVDSTINVRDSATYTSVIYGYQDTVSSIFVEDRDATNFDASKAYIRFFNLSENTPSVKVNLIQNGTPTNVFNDRPVDNQTSATANAGFIATNQGSYTIQVTDMNGTQLALRDEAATLSAGRYYTILTRGINGNAQKPMVVGIFQH
ncbi:MULTISPECIES: DUF4397 domain-containing protein [Olivibacter]|jgi:hypothetical protein|uniref:DUF4397 domain-containing protein n=1 Tax=Olivibacter oleidegradans TaxID=760123 RepID=A0ABV6HF52_9SPHI|nr:MULTISPECIES: DUF4397 domain-containing protein [Olivibacter]MDM8177564.1 DUF4397 domain-containing protein [Olivibacter sp. 47]QEL00009.1 DUF4397 domain-containing protein [Olivibacter sp. LS-1]